MAQLNITLNQDEILQLLCNDRDEAFRQLLESSLNTLLQAESTEQLHAEPYERSAERKDSRNGSYDRDLTTRIGTITLHVPRHRNQKFATMIFDNYSRSEASLIACMAEMVINGVSTRKVAKVVETICGKEFSKSTVSELCKKLEEMVKSFQNRPLNSNYPFVTVDATYFKVRERHQVVSKAFMIAYGTNDQGHREILGFDVFHNESKETWNTFFRSLRRRGLGGLLMITENARVLVEVNHRAVLAADGLAGADDDGRGDGALLDGARRGRLLDRDPDHVAEMRVLLALPEDAEAHGALGARVVRNHQIGEFLQHCLFSFTSRCASASLR